MHKPLISICIASALVLSGCEFPKIGSWFSSSKTQETAVQHAAAAPQAQAPAKAQSPVKAQPAPAQRGTTVQKSDASSGNAGHAVKPIAEKDRKVYEKLEKFAADYLMRCNKFGAATKAKPQITRVGKEFTARYVEIEMNNYTLELFPSAAKSFSYMAKLVYFEDTFEAHGKTSAEAAKGPYKQVRTRKLTELPRYSGGKWLN